MRVTSFLSVGLAVALGGISPLAAQTLPASAESLPNAPSASTPASAPPADDAPATGATSDAPAVDATRGSAFRAYHAALASRRLAASAPLSVERIDAELARIEQALVAGRRDEAIADLVYIVESPRFEPFAGTDSGRAALFWLGDSLGRAGAYEPARAYLRRLLANGASDTWFRRAVSSLVDFALETKSPEASLAELDAIEARCSEQGRSEIEYLRGRVAEAHAEPARALEAYAKVSEHSRYWAHATYLSGVIEVERRNLKRGEELFCRVADPKRTPPKAAAFSGGDFFRIRDLSRLGLGRVAHEQYRFDDARYYYYLVPHDSEHLPEALYETATTRYEAKDYAGARAALDDLKRLSVEHRYQDEAWILDAFVELAECRFAGADRRLTEFLRRYEPARDAARKLLNDEPAMQRLLESVRKGSDPAGAGLGIAPETARALGAALRVDADYQSSGRRIAQVEHQLSGLRGTLGELDAAATKLTAKAETRPAARTLEEAPFAKLQRVDAQISELRRLLREAAAAGGAGVAALSSELEALELRARALRAALPSGVGSDAGGGAELEALLAADRARAVALASAGEKLLTQLTRVQFEQAKASFVRLDKRLTRLVNRARLGRIETVLGRKRALEIEVEALSQGYLPGTVVDSLRAERYLRSDEEYWPFEGEDWEDEYIGGEGLR